MARDAHHHRGQPARVAAQVDDDPVRLPELVDRRLEPRVDCRHPDVEANDANGAPAGVCFFVASTRTNIVGRFPTVTACPASACRSSESATGCPLPSSKVTSTRDPDGPRNRDSETRHASTLTSRPLSPLGFVPAACSGAPLRRSVSAAPWERPGNARMRSATDASPIFTTRHPALTWGTFRSTWVTSRSSPARRTSKPGSPLQIADRQGHRRSRERGQSATAPAAGACRGSPPAAHRWTSPQPHAAAIPCEPRSSRRRSSPDRSACRG